jgi:hypothetical protein
VDERQAIAALIDRLVRESRIGSRRAREELRRELESHFDEAGSSPEALRAAMERFGSADAVRDGFRRAYRRGRVALYVAKVVASVAASAAVALALQVAVNVRIGLGADALRLAPGYGIGARTSLAIVLLIVAAWELGIDPLCARLERRPVRMLTTLATFFAAICVTHLVTDNAIAPAHALVASGVLIAVWTCTIAILARLESVFVSLLGEGLGSRV